MRMTSARNIQSIRPMCVVVLAMFFSFQTGLPVNATSCFIFKLVIIEMNGTTDMTIDCNTTDLNANVTLLLNNDILPVGGRVTLHKQVFTIHNITTSDYGQYDCVTRSGSSTKVWCQTTVPFIRKEELVRYPKVTPEVKVIGAGTSTNFTCKVKVENSFQKYFTLKWFREENGTHVEIRQDDTMYRQTVVSYGHSVLTIINAQPTPREGVTFRCQVTYRDTASSFYPRLIVVEDFPPNITELKESVIVKEKDMLSQHCTARSFPLSNITWIYNGAELLVGNHYIVLQNINEQWLTSTSYLIIKSTSFPRDNGTYTCVAKNGNSSDEKNMEVSIDTVPFLDKSHSLWTNRRIYCQVSRSNPLPTFKWQYQRDPCLNFNPECKPDKSRWSDLPASFAVSPPSDDATRRSTVAIPKDTESGFFRCKATNREGSAENVMKFFVSGTNSARITMTTKEYDEEGVLNMSCVMTCKGKMSGWYKDGRELLAATDPRINITSGTESGLTWTNLVVKKLTANDSGVYICAATDCQSRPLNVSEDIKVNKVFPPTILNFKNQTAYNQISTELFCNISAHPMPSQVHWFKAGLPLEDQIEYLNRLLSSGCETHSPGFYRINGVVGKLIICKPADLLHTGFYTCNVANRKGEINATAFLNVLENPVVLRPANVTHLVKLGEPWNSTCQVTGNPVPKIEWKRMDGNGKGNVAVNQKWENNKEVVLLLESVSEQDIGTYFCIAVNSKGIAVAFMELDRCAILMFVVGIGKFLLVDPARTLQDQCGNLSYDPSWEFPEERLTLGEVLGSGAFGEVIKAEAFGIADFHPRCESAEKVKRRSKMLRRISSSRLYQDSSGSPYVKTTVAVKTLKKNAKPEDFDDLASELKILIHVGEHKNIVNLLGACTKGDRLFIIMEYAPNGNLLMFLRKKREIYEPTWITTTNNPENELTIRNLVVFAYQIARGMEFLASKQCIHRDLAARNVLVGEDYVMKVADFGLARNISKRDMYVKQTQGVLPIKWMAMESLFDRVYTEKSDV
ncbi:Fibroblast growth factor receptor 1 [Stylophora pistillata]|uniref:receptor protein-tyrosine kinase n=1 Tax=Stylophora pistillata TaxID=50429 RepID=A0A2B4R7W2_STYPI|nr:Fibroblast growth factor receptor 1 [Stylophora pistillata]